MKQSSCTLSRRSFVKRAMVQTMALGAAGCAGLPEKKGRRPNVVLILADDMGTLDLNCYGSNDLYTPNLDELARRGTKFSQFYMGAPVCSPSRGCVLTGRYSNHNGVPGNGRSLNPDEVTIAEMLKPYGYHTGIIGKWHVGEKPGPLGEGFDYFFGHLGGCIENYNHNFIVWDTGDYKFHDLWRNDTLVYEHDTHFGELIVREVNGFLDRHGRDPFFLYIPFNNPHYPVQPLPHHLDRYTHMSEPRRSYGAFVSTMDEQIGKIINRIDRMGLRDDTLIIFMSDHGHSVESRNNLWLDEPAEFAGGGNAGPYRGNKFTVWEGGLRVPSIVSMPGTVPENETRDQIASSLDWLPTIARYCRIPLPDREIDGKDISGVIASGDTKTPHRVLYRQFKDQWVVREGKWKLVGNGPATRTKEGKELPFADLFLSDMSKDVTETNNLADKYPRVVERLNGLHEAWLKKIGITQPPPRKRKRR